MIRTLPPLKPRVTFLEKLARAVEPKPGERARSVERRIKPMHEISEGRAARKNFQDTGIRKATNALVTTYDETTYRYHTDGSLRHAFGKAPKKTKRQRRHVLRFGGVR